MDGRSTSPAKSTRQSATRRSILLTMRFFVLLVRLKPWRKNTGTRTPHETDTERGDNPSPDTRDCSCLHARAMADENGLIQAVTELLNSHGSEISANEAHEILSAREEWQALSLSAVKKAKSKAKKQQAQAPAGEEAQASGQSSRQQRGRAAARIILEGSVPQAARNKPFEEVTPIDFMNTSGLMETMHQMMEAEKEHGEGDGEMPEQFRKGCGSLEEAVALPRSGEVWFAGCHEVRAGLEDFERKTMVFLVEDETNEDARPWPEHGGLSLVLASIAEGRRYEHPENRERAIVTTVISACCSPGWHFGFNFKGDSSTTFRRRPSKLLVTNEAIASSLGEQLHGIGIKIRCATNALVQSFRAGAAVRAASQQRLSESDVASQWPDGLRGVGLHLRDQLQLDEVANAAARRASAPTKDKKPIKLPRSLRKELVEEGGLPADWFVEMPGPGTRVRQCWGWRTKFEDALFCSDIPTARAIIKGREMETVREYAEMRILLTRTAAKGLVAACELLLHEVKCAVDGVQAKSNKGEWRLCQIGAGDSGNAAGSTPLLLAVTEAESTTAQLLLGARADPNLRSPTTGGTALHVACARRPQSPKIVEILLNDPRTDTTLADRHGSTALALAEVMHASYGSASSALILDLMSGQLKGTDCCVQCGSRPERLQKCPCGFAWYCGKACQKLHWKHHKPVHKMRMGESASGF